MLVSIKYIIGSYLLFINKIIIKTILNSNIGTYNTVHVYLLCIYLYNNMMGDKIVYITCMSRNLISLIYSVIIVNN